MLQEKLRSEGYMNIEQFLPIYKDLSKNEQELIDTYAFTRDIKAGTIIHNSDSDCLGLTIVVSGQLRVYMQSLEGREITLYRLLDLDVCLFTASCTMQSFQNDITISAEKDSTLIVIPANIYKQLISTSLSLATYANEIMAMHFSEVMWLLEQIIWKSFDKRLASFLVEESNLENTTSLHITHEKIANHLGTAREVVTRMLKYFQNEGLVKLTRGQIEIINKQVLRKLFLST